MGSLTEIAPQTAIIGILSLVPRATRSLILTILMSTARILLHLAIKKDFTNKYYQRAEICSKNLEKWKFHIYYYWKRVMLQKGPKLGFPIIFMLEPFLVKLHGNTSQMSKKLASPYFFLVQIFSRLTIHANNDVLSNYFRWEKLHRLLLDRC